MAKPSAVHEYGVPSVLLDPGDDQRLWEGFAVVAPCDVPTRDNPRLIPQLLSRTPHHVQ
jgi:hypothetical protein